MHCPDGMEGDSCRCRKTAGEYRTFGQAFSRMIEFRKLRKIHFDWLTPKHFVGKVFDVFLKLLVIHYPMIVRVHACRGKKNIKDLQYMRNADLPSSNFINKWGKAMQAV